MSPTGRFLTLLCFPALLSLALTLFPQVKVPILVMDSLLLVFILLDALSIPRRKQLRLTRLGSSILSLGTTNPFELVLENYGRRTLLLRITESFPSTMTVEGLPVNTKIKARGHKHIKYRVIPRQRGAFEVSRTYLQVSSRMGLWQRHFKLFLPLSLKVFPNVKAMGTYALLARRNLIELMGFRKTRGRGSEVEFDRLREYQQDDDYRRIDPYASARYQRLITREYEVSRNQNIFFMIDSSRPMAAESHGLSNLDHALNATLMMSNLALEVGDNVGLMVFDEKVKTLLPLSYRRRAKTEILHALYNVHESMAEANYEQAFRTVHQQVQKRSLVVFMTNIMDEASFDRIQPHLKLLRQRHLCLILLFRDEDLFDLAEIQPKNVNEFYSMGAACELVNWRERVATELRGRGGLLLDLSPSQATPQLINMYLKIKAEQLL